MRLQANRAKARELADMVGSVVVDENIPLEVLEIVADLLKEDCRQIRQAANDIKEEQQERRVKVANKAEKHTVAYRNVKKCEFHNIGSHIVATSIIGGTTFCAFFDSGLHTEESIRRRGSIKLHSIYSKK